VQLAGNGIKRGPRGRGFRQRHGFRADLLELAGVKPHAQMVGRSLIPVLRSEKSGQIDAARNAIVVAKERHDIGRPHDWGYPVRAIRTKEFLYVRNFIPTAGRPEIPRRILATLILRRARKSSKPWAVTIFDLSLGKRPAEESLPADRGSGGREQSRRGTPHTRPRCANSRSACSPSFAPRKIRVRSATGPSSTPTRYVGSRAKGYDTWLKKTGRRSCGRCEEYQRWRRSPVIALSPLFFPLSARLH